MLAAKMAELDAIFERLFTAPPFTRGRRQLLMFGDICAGPGGFSEYMLTVLKWRAMGFGQLLTSVGFKDWGYNIRDVCLIKSFSSLLFLPQCLVQV